MARGINKVILVGTVGKDPEVKYMPNGGAVANVSVATHESWKDKASGEKKETTEWHRVVFFRQLAETVGKYVRKGHQIYIEGSLKTRSWEKDGQKHYTTEIIASDMQMLSSRQGGEMGAGSYDDIPPSNDNGGYASPRPPLGQSSVTSQGSHHDHGFEDFGDDIPF